MDCALEHYQNATDWSILIIGDCSTHSQKLTDLSTTLATKNLSFADNPDAAFEMLKLATPDIIISPFASEKKPGWDVVTKSCRENRYIPTIIVENDGTITARHNEQDVRFVFKRGWPDEQQLQLAVNELMSWPVGWS